MLRLHITVSKCKKECLMLAFFCLAYFYPSQYLSVPLTHCNDKALFIFMTKLYLIMHICHNFFTHSCTDDYQRQNLCACPFCSVKQFPLLSSLGLELCGQTLLLYKAPCDFWKTSLALQIVSGAFHLCLWHSIPSMKVPIILCCNCQELLISYIQSFVFFPYFISITFSPCLVEIVWGWVACASCSINFMILEQQMQRQLMFDPEMLLLIMETPLVQEMLVISDLMYHMMVVNPRQRRKWNRTWT